MDIDKLLEKAKLQRGHIYTTPEGRLLLLQDPENDQPESVVKMTEEDQKKMVGYMKSNQNDVGAAYKAFLNVTSETKTRKKSVYPFSEKATKEKIMKWLKVNGVKHPHYKNDEVKGKIVFWNNSAKMIKQGNPKVNSVDLLRVKRALKKGKSLAGSIKLSMEFQIIE